MDVLLCTPIENLIKFVISTPQQWEVAGMVVYLYSVHVIKPDVIRYQYATTMGGSRYGGLSVPNLLNRLF